MKSCVISPLSDELHTGGGEVVYLEVISDGQNVLHAPWAEGDGIEVHVVNYLVHYSAVRDIFQLHTGGVLLFKLAEHRPEVRDCGYCAVTQLVT